MDTRAHDRFETADTIRAAGVPVSVVATPEDRIDHDPGTIEFGLWPTVHHTEMGDVRVDGVPVHLSMTDWHIEHGAPCLGEHTREVLRDVVGLSDDEIDDLEKEKVV